MEIGGYDLVFTSLKPIGWYDPVDLCRMTWRNLVVELDAVEEGNVMVYKNMDVAFAWSKDKPESYDLSSQMIYLIMTATGFIAVVEDPEHPEVKEIADSFRDVFQEQILKFAR